MSAEFSSAWGGLELGFDPARGAKLYLICKGEIFFISHRNHKFFKINDTRLGKV